MHIVTQNIFYEVPFKAQIQTHMTRLLEHSYMYNVFKRAVDTDRNSTRTQHPIFL